MNTKSLKIKSSLCFENWGLLDYQTSVDKQLKYIEEIFLGTRLETIIFCSHPPVVSLGRATKAEDLGSWKGQLVESSRGGRATYHGPSQLVIYPLINLSKKRPLLIDRDIHAYLRLLEKTLAEALQTLGFQHYKGKLGVNKTSEGLEKTGLWKGDLKVASIGVAIKKWISYHGVAINLQKDAQAFTGIKACGYEKNIMTSLEELELKIVAREDLIKALTKNFQSMFGI